MVVKKAFSFLSELGETALSKGMNTCKNTICKINQLIVYSSGEGAFKDHLKSVFKSNEIIKKENIIRIKEKLILKNRMQKDFDTICCPNCGLALPPYYIFCLYCGTQLFNDILNSDSKKRPITLSKTLTNLLNLPFFLDNVKLLVFFLQELKTQVSLLSL